MKKILYFLFGVALLSLASCWPNDNWDEPDCTFYGTITDSYTNQPILTSQNDWVIRLWERSWTASEPQYQTIPIKQDGTYKNTKLFAGTFDMLPYDGPFWPVSDTTKNVVLGKSTEQNFTVTPYLQVIEFDNELGTANFGSAQTPDIKPALTLRCRLKAPLKSRNGVNLPNLVEVKAFLSLNALCGNSSYINITDYNSKRIQINRSWSSEMTNRFGLDGSTETSGVYSIGPLQVKSGYTYHVRIGANVSVGNNRYIYSPIVKVTVP